MPINPALLDMDALVGLLGLAVDQIDRGEANSHDEQVIHQAAISLRAAGAPVPDHWMPSAQPDEPATEASDPLLVSLTDDQLVSELRERGLVLSIWSSEDVLSHIEDDDECQHLTAEQMAEAAEALLDRVHRHLEDTLAARGNEFLGDRWCWDKEEILTELGLLASDDA